MSEIGFEKALEDLEEIVSKMEQGNLTLDQSLEQYEKGVKLIRHCNKKLDSCEKRIEIITKNDDDEFEKSDFEELENKKAPKKTKAKKAETKTIDDKEEGMLF